MKPEEKGVSLGAISNTKLSGPLTAVASLPEQEPVGAYAP